MTVPTFAAGLLAALLLLATPTAHAAHHAALPGTKVIETAHDYATLVARTRQAVTDNKMGIVAVASATAGAKSIGVTIPGNMVIMVFRPDFAVRMLKASVPAGIEAPLRLYVTEGADGKASVTYRTPSAVFAPYGNADLDAMAKELDPILARIVAAATGG